MRLKGDGAASWVPGNFRGCNVEHDTGGQGLVHQMGCDGVHPAADRNKEAAFPDRPAWLQFTPELLLDGIGYFVLQGGVHTLAFLRQHKEAAGAAV